jgi:PAS domain S-box-containing protein
VVIDEIFNQTHPVNHMLDDELEEQAALYASGAMSVEEREQFELLLEFHTELKQLVSQLEEVASAVVLATSSTGPTPSAGLKERLLQRIDAGLPQEKPHGFVVAGADGFVRWVNPEFTEMCGYSLPELQGKKLGPILQGKLTDPEVSAYMRTAVVERRPCDAELINYHKNGSPYWVRIHIRPIFDSKGDTRWLVAHEQELTDRPIPVAA